MQRVKEVFKIAFYAIVIWLCIRTFFFEVFVIPTGSMRGTLVEGDYIFVNKLAYGARLPITPLSIPFAHQSYFLNWISIPYLRIPGYSEIQRNDVIVFNYPMDSDFPIDHRTFYVKRCVALPGDTLLISNGNLFINNVQVTPPEQTQFSYTVETDSCGLDSLTIQNLNLDIRGAFSLNKRYDIIMTDAVADSLQKTKHILSVTQNILSENIYDENIFPNNLYFKWNVDNWGSTVIPQKNQTVILNSNTIYLYKRIIELYEYNKLEIKNDSVFINNKYALSYTFKQNYYFVMGDNRHDSNDSRMWGFLPEDHIVGRASYILFSKNNEVSLEKKSRTFKSIK